MSDQTLTIADDSPAQTDLTDKNCHLTDAEPAHTDRPPGSKRVSPEQAAHIVSLKRMNPDLTQAEIARAVGVDRSTVSRWLSAMEHDTTDDARKFYAANQLQAAVAVVDRLDDKDSKVVLKSAELMHRVGGLLEDSRPQMNVAVVLGVTLQPPSAQALTVSVSPAQDGAKVQADGEGA
jgi:transcriptional regulator with XRE-family HTH domain